MSEPTEQKICTQYVVRLTAENQDEEEWIVDWWSSVHKAHSHLTHGEVLSQFENDMVEKFEDFGLDLAQISNLPTAAWTNLEFWIYSTDADPDVAVFFMATYLEKFHPDQHKLIMWVEYVKGSFCDLSAIEECTGAGAYVGATEIEYFNFRNLANEKYSH